MVPGEGWTWPLALEGTQGWEDTYWLVKSNKICYLHRFLHENLGLFILLYSTRFSVPVDGEKIDNVREW